MGVPHLPPAPLQVRTGAMAHPSNHEAEPDVRVRWCVGTFGAVGVITVVYGGGEADAKKVLESLTVLGKSRLPRNYPTGSLYFAF